MTAPVCDAGMAKRKAIPDVDGDGLADELVTFDGSRIIDTIGPDCFYRLIGQDSYCPADGYSNDDGMKFLKLTSGKTLSQLTSLTDDHGRTFSRGQKVALHYVGYPSINGVIERFSDSFISIDEGTLFMTGFEADVKLDDGTIEKNIPLELIAHNDAVSRMERGLTELYWDWRLKAENFLYNL